MNHRRQTRRGPAAIAISALGVVVLVVASWLVVGPSTLGGPFSYVFINGSSMEPVLHHRDLVLLRTHTEYHVGDMVAYRHPKLGTVLHRIVDEQYGRFTMQGDNRPDVDTYAPLPEDVIGAVWVQVPGATPVIEALQSPRNAALLVVAVGALGVSRGFGRPKRRRGRRPRDRDPDRGPTRPPAGAPAGLASLGIYSATGGLLAGLGVMLAVGSVVLPRFIDPAATATTTDTRSYNERGAFTYERTVLGGVYDDDRLTAPQPLFRQLASTLPIAFDYTLEAPAAGLGIEDVRGTLELWGELRRSDGWSRRVELRSPLEFTGAHATIQSLVDLQSTDGLMDAVTEATGIDSGTYTLRVYASHEATATFAGQPIERTGTQFVEFMVGDLSVELIQGASELSREESGTVPVISVRPATFALPLLGTEFANVEVPGFARLAQYGAGAVFLVVALASWLTWRAGEDARIRARYGALLLRAALSEHRAAARTITVSTFADLARVAEGEGLLVLHEPHLRGGVEYRVFATDATYRYRSAAPAEAGDAPTSSQEPPPEAGPRRPMPFGPSTPPPAPPTPAPTPFEGAASSRPAASAPPALPSSVLPPLRRTGDAA
ncbi:MAG: signal peptidase I [Dehalococcoidia bacterium]